MSLIFATQLTAVATTVLALFAIVTAVFAILALLKQSKEVSDQASMLAIHSNQLAEQRGINEKQTTVLELQADELRASIRQREREAADRRREQASRVFIQTVTGSDSRIPQTQRAVDDLTHEAVTARITNTSVQPIYDVTIGWRRGTAPWGEPDHIAVLMPNEANQLIRGLPVDLHPTVNRSLFSAVARFRDSFGVRWLLRPNGQLDEEPPSGNDAPRHTASDVG